MRIDITLASPHYAQGKKLRKILFFCLLALSAALLFNGYAYVTAKGELKHYRKRVGQLSTRVPAGTLKVGGFRVDPSELKKTERSVSSLNQIIYQDAFSWVGLLNELEEITPKEVSLAVLDADFKKGEIQITGEANLSSQGTDFLKNLQKSKFLRACFLVSQKTEEKKGHILFEIKGQLRHISHGL
ncbi:MAG: PilN domain-containing protein [Thermodesulfobacteriota bacterium]